MVGAKGGHFVGGELRDLARLLVFFEEGFEFGEGDPFALVPDGAVGFEGDGEGAVGGGFFAGGAAGGKIDEIDVEDGGDEHEGDEDDKDDVNEGGEVEGGLFVGLFVR